MHEIEQLLQEALNELRRSRTMKAWDKAQLCGRLEDMAARAYAEFADEDEREGDAAWAETCRRFGWTP